MQTASFPIHQGYIVDSILQPDDQCDWLVNDSQENAKTAASQKEAEPDFILGKVNSSTSTFLLTHDSIKVNLNNESLSYTEVMQQRWVIATNGSQITPLKERSSDVSEYMKSSYLRLRHIEESLPINNYFDRKVNPAFKNFFESFEDEKVAKKKLRRIISINDRAYAVQKIMNIHAAKNYCKETLFTAVNIMDRYLFSVGHWNFPRLKICLLATTSLILAAKMEEKFAPSFEFTLQFLTDED